ncbi:MAG: ytcC [Bacteroidetes bacterium]|nr:ytcC [Bacteroidota bacterium]
MNVAIVTSGILPVPPVKGGAVENLVKFYLDYNEVQNVDIQFTVYSVYDKLVPNTDLLKYKKTKFVFINTSIFISKLRKLLFRFTSRNLYYHHSWEFFISEVAHRVKEEKFDVIIVENRPGFALRLSKSTDAKLILHLHNDMLNIDSKDASEIFSLYTKVLTVSRYIKERVDTIMPTRKNFHLSEDDFVVVYTGRIEAVKGVKELLKAFSLLANYKEIKLLIVGGGNGNINEGEFFLEMAELASSMPEQVFFTGFQSYDKIPLILSLCDIAVVPSIWEDPFPTTVLESLAAGLPLIVTRSGGIPEAVNENNAIVLDRNVNLVTNLANSIVELYLNKDKRTLMSVHAKECSRLFDKDIYAKKLLFNL